LFRKLSVVPMAKPSSVEVLSGIHAVSEALAAGRRRVYAIGVADADNRQRLSPLLASAEAAGIRVSRMSADKITRKAGTARHQGVFADVGPLPVMGLGALTDLVIQAPESAFVLILDQIEDTHNLGALLRTALCAGVTAAVLPKDRSARLTPVVSRISAGAMEHIPVAVVPNLAETVRRLKKHGMWAVGLDRDGSADLFAYDVPGSVALVVGNENRGIRPLMRRLCDTLVAIPQADRLNSLNASVAGGIAMFEVMRQRRAAGA